MNIKIRHLKGSSHCKIINWYSGLYIIFKSGNHSHLLKLPHGTGYLFSLSPFSTVGHLVAQSPGHRLETDSPELWHRLRHPSPRTVCIEVVWGFNEGRLYILKAYVRNTVIFSGEYPMNIYS